MRSAAHSPTLATMWIASAAPPRTSAGANTRLEASLRSCSRCRRAARTKIERGREARRRRRVPTPWSSRADGTPASRCRRASAASAIVASTRSCAGAAPSRSERARGRARAPREACRRRTERRPEKRCHRCSGRTRVPPSPAHQRQPAIGAASSGSATIRVMRALRRRSPRRASARRRQRAHVHRALAPTRRDDARRARRRADPRARSPLRRRRAMQPSAAT